MTVPAGAVEFDAEDAKLVTLARGARGRAAVGEGAEGAAVRDGDGRTYAAATVALPSLALSALQAAVAAAVASGAQDLEAAVLVTGRPAGPAGPDGPDGNAGVLDADRAVLRDLRCPVLVVAGPDGVPRQRSAP